MLKIFSDYLINNFTIIIFFLSLFFTISGRIRLEYLLGYNYFSLPVKNTERTKKNIFFICLWALLFLASLITKSPATQIMFLLFFMLEYYDRGPFTLSNSYFATMFFNKKGVIFSPNTRPILFSSLVKWEYIEKISYGAYDRNFVDMFVFVRNRKKPVKMKIFRNLRLRYDEVFELYLRNEPFSATLN